MAFVETCRHWLLVETCRHWLLLSPPLRPPPRCRTRPGFEGCMYRKGCDPDPKGDPPLPKQYEGSYADDPRPIVNV